MSGLVSHAFSNTIVDATGTVTIFNASGRSQTIEASALVGAAQWNSAHANFMTLAGNTAGVSTISGSNIIVSGNNNVTLSGVQGANVATLGISAGADTIDQISFSAGTSSVALGSLIFSNSNNISFGLNGSTVTASVSSSFSAINLSAGTTSNNLTAAVFSNSNNATFGLAGSTITVSAPINFSAGTTSGNLTQLSFGNGSNVSFGLNAGTITASISGPVTLSSYQPLGHYGADTSSSGAGPATSGIVSVAPFTVNAYVSVGIMDLMATVGFTTLGTSTGNQTGGIWAGIYTRGTGASTSLMSVLASSSFSWQVTGNNSSYTIAQITSTGYAGYGASAATNSAGSLISSGYTGGKKIGIPINTLLTPGVYWLALFNTNSTSGTDVGMTMQFFGAHMPSISNLAPIGSFSTSYSTGIDPAGGRFNMGAGSWSSTNSSTGLPVSMAFASISAGWRILPFMNFWST